MQKRKQMIGAVVFAAIVLASGCLTVAVDSQVNNDGTIDTYEIRMELPSMVYQQMQSQAQENDTTLSESIKQGYNEENYGSISVETEQDQENNQGIITITLENFDPADIEGSDFSGGNSGGQGQGPNPEQQASGPQIDVTVEEERITYVDDSFNTPENGSSDEDDGGQFGGQFTLEYTLTMPGPIIESETNADEIDGRTAKWNETGADVLSNTEIRAASERGSGGGGLGLPGFGAGLAVVAMLVAAGAMAAVRKRREN